MMKYNYQLPRRRHQGVLRTLLSYLIAFIMEFYPGEHTPDTPQKRFDANKRLFF